MKGLEISRRFATEWLLPFLDRELPALRARVAVGRFMGSDALGADDHLSRDHNWGPTLEGYLDDDYAGSDAELAARINSAAPREFLGTRRSGGHDAAITLRRTHAYIKSIFGRVPEEPREWVIGASQLEQIESPLYFLRHGALFHDGSGQLTALRERFHSYPTDLHRLRLAICCYDIAHYGEYNFVWRLVERNDVVAMQIALGHFSQAVMRLHFYLERDYAPYWKWLPREFRRRGYSPPIGEKLVALPRLSPAEQASTIQSICSLLGAQLRDLGVVPHDIPNPYGAPWFFRFREEILSSIEDPVIRNLTW